MKKELQKNTQTKNFKKNQPMRITCNASREGLLAVLEQLAEEGWQATHFASRFLTRFKQKCSKNELEHYVVVWAFENFRNFVHGTQLEVVSDHKALTGIPKGNRAKKTYSSRLTRWIDRQHPFQFTVTHANALPLRMADHFSRHPSPSNKANQV